MSSKKKKTKKSKKKNAGERMEEYTDAEESGWK